MNKFLLRSCEALIRFLESGERKYLGYAIAAPVLLAGIAIQHQIVPPASVVRDVAIYVLCFLAVAVMIRVYVRYVGRELRRA